jgi:hypothetical protein
MSNVAQWIVEALGQMVELTKPLEGPCERYEKGSACRLLGIHWSPQRIYVTVALDPNDESYEENIALDGIAPIRQ